MNRVLTTLALVLAGGGLTPLARAESAPSPGQMRVEDNAGAFTPEGVKKAERAFSGATFPSPTRFTVVTVGDKDVPESKKADFEAAKKDRKQAGPFFSNWTRDLARKEREKGVFALVYSQGDKFFVDVITDRETDVYRHFSDSAARKLSEALQAGFREAKGKPADQAKAAHDAALLAATNVVIDQLKNTSAPEPRNGKRADVANHGNAGKGIGGTSIMSWVCVGLVVLLGVWLVIGLIRAFTGGGHGGGGYGPGGGGYGGGGGGGGFFPSLLGGLFGAAAGMYMYDSFFGGHHAASAGDAMGAGGYDNGPMDTGAGDFDAGAEAGGGDFGDAGGDVGGGDFGDAGGGDFGGGDFGGGDFGGGGGDFGGGDW